VRVIAELDRSARGPFPFDIALPHGSKKYWSFCGFRHRPRNSCHSPNRPMSALGQKRTCAVQNRMSALLLKADMEHSVSGPSS